MSGAAVGFTLFAFQNAVAHSDQKAQQRQESHQRQSDARQGLLLALNMGPDLRGIDATTLDDLVNAAIAPAAADAQSGSGGVLPQGTASSRDLCEDKQAPQRRPESKVLKNIRLTGKTLDFANFSGMTLRGLDLSKASLRHARFCFTVFENVKLVGADLTGANLDQAVLRKVDLQFAKLDEALVASADYEDALVNSETCWPTRFGDGYTKLKTQPQKLANPFAPVPEPSRGHLCTTDEGKLYLTDRQAWFARAS